QSAAEKEAAKQVASLEAELKKRSADSDKELEKLRSDIALATKQKTSIESTLSDLKTNVENLEKELSLLNDQSDLLSAGFYKSKYNFDKSEKFEALLDQKRDLQKQAIKDKKAIVCSTEWTVSGSKAEGKKMTDRIIRLGLSAFNVQCDNEILKLKFDNIDRAEERLGKIRDNIDKLLEPNHCRITRDFFQLKLDELFLTYEYVQKVHEEKEEQKAIREQMKEEERARREAEKAEADAEKEAKKCTEALEKARLELEKKPEADQTKFLTKIAELEARLANALENKERAKSMAEMTRQGYVYIISNIGSFGENVFKIGMTRRLDPMDRVYELGDASVPFDFDVHAIIKSDDAPTLESTLHRQFDERRMNRVNQRKEFFKVDIKDIEAACRKHTSAEFKLTLLAEASEWRRTVALSSEQKKTAA
ncbi:MAG: DUF4041 domain-containing protein, partial [Bdellovibrionales bacterium]|nr:DUF4041 domain-containing protein [Bdellovibrionales bacterium]